MPLLALSVVSAAAPSAGAAPQRLTLPVEVPQRFQVDVQFEDASTVRCGDPALEPGRDSQAETLFAFGRPTGRVPNGADVAGTQLTLNRLPTGDVSLTWSDSCNVQDSDYAVYEGVLGGFASHL